VSCVGLQTQQQTAVSAYTLQKAIVSDDKPYNIAIADQHSSSGGHLFSLGHCYNSTVETLLEIWENFEEWIQSVH
jgi:hypothetical protein